MRYGRLLLQHVRSDLSKCFKRPSDAQPPAGNDVHNSVDDTATIKDDSASVDGDTVDGMSLEHLNDVPEQDRELVSPTEITQGDEVFYPPGDQWVTIERVVAGLDPSQSSWRLDEGESGWTFVHSFADVGAEPMVSGSVERRKR
jgi:hypothetical protein